MTPRRPIALLVTAALALAACSASGDDAATDPTSTTSGGPTSTEVGPTTTRPVETDPDQVLVDAVDATLALGGFTAVAVSDLEANGQNVRLEVEAVVDYDARIADADLSVDAPTGDADLAIRADGKRLWVRSTNVRMPEGKTWLEGDASLLDSDNFSTTGLLGTILILRAATDTTVENESEDIDGVDTTVYRTSFTYDDAVDAAGDDVDALKSSLQLTWREPVDLDVTAWVDADGIIRRLHVEIDPDDDTPLDGTYDLDLSTPDSIEAPDAPAAADVLSGTEADRLLKQVIAGN